MKNTRKIGSYEPIKIKKNIWWDVNLGRGEGFLAKTQFEAEVIGKLERIERAIERMEKQKIRITA